jgi:hypothetical protein
LGPLAVFPEHVVDLTHARTHARTRTANSIWAPQKLATFTINILSINMSRTVAVIDGEIAGIKAGNSNWLADAGDKALITALTNEKNQLGEFKC